MPSNPNARNTPWLPALPFGEQRAEVNADIGAYQQQMASAITGVRRYEALDHPRTFRQKSMALAIRDLRLAAGANTPVAVEVDDSRDTTLMVPFYGRNLSVNGTARHLWGGGEAAMFYPSMGRAGESGVRSTLMINLQPQRLQATAEAMLGLEPGTNPDLGTDRERVLPLHAGPFDFDRLFRALCAMIDLQGLRSDLLALQGVDDQIYRLVAMLLNPGLFLEGRGPTDPAGDCAALDPVVEHVLAHLDGPLGLSDLERLSGMSARRLLEAFQRRFQQSPRQWIREARLRRARQELLEAGPEATWPQICEASGFGDDRAFKRLYLDRFGETPEATLAKGSADRTGIRTGAGRFLAQMSHEIRTPLNAVLGFTELLADRTLDADSRELVSGISQAGETLLGIVNEVLDYSKIESGELHLESRPVDLGELVRQVVGMLQGSATLKGLRLETLQPPETLPALLGDGLRIKQVLLNLVGNAIKFTAQGAVTVEICVIVRSAEGLRLGLEVRDTGIGMSAEALAGLFRPFVQADASISRRFGGTGLGLAISKRLVEAMGGTIVVRSEVGHGSSFRCELPFALAPSSAAFASGGTAGERGLSGLRLLVVDDDPVHRKLVEGLLRPLGVVTSTAANGAEAVTRLIGAPADFDAVLMDIQMPVLDGLAAIQALRDHPATAALPIIAVSAGVFPGEQEQARSSGASAFLAKPVRLHQLLAVLHGLVSARKLPPS